MSLSRQVGILTQKPPLMTATVRATIDPVSLALLVDPRPARAIDVLRVALAVLAAAGHLEIDATPRGETFVRVRHAPPPGTPEHIAAVFRVLRDADRGGGLSRASASQALTRAFGARFRRYVKSLVAPALATRGMLRIETTRLLWVFTALKLQRTAQGDTTARRLERQLAALDALPALVESDPVRAFQRARDAGPFLLLWPAARTSLPRLRALAPVALAASAYTLVEEPEPEWIDLLEHADLLMSIDFDSLLEVIDAIADFGGDGGSGTGADGDGGSDGGGDGGGGGGD
jgi:uncharacterized membrane protein YgcG